MLFDLSICFGGIFVLFFIYIVIFLFMCLKLYLMCDKLISACANIVSSSTTSIVGCFVNYLVIFLFGLNNCCFV